MSSAHPVMPVKPSGMELIFYYICPFCNREISLVSPQQPSLITCDMCRKKFPIVPVDMRSVYYVRIMMGNGLAAIDPDFM
ncbi:hypothetical protein FACS1894168_3590 [Deltaproteobacteria bacterium]|nr:hypothetical protein FACS1894168_3590 [Deltaproteobacteria bacterium]